MPSVLLLSAGIITLGWILAGSTLNEVQDIGEAGSQKDNTVVQMEVKPKPLDRPQLRKQCQQSFHECQVIIDTMDLREEDSNLQTAKAQLEQQVGNQAYGACEIREGAAGWVDMHLVEGTAKHSLVTSSNIVAMGDSLQTRTCTLQGVATFTSIQGSAIAQMDPNLRDPIKNNPLCAPLAAMVFFAGVVEDETAPITRSVAVQIEPHGRLHVLGKEPHDLKIRLDGITYHPQTQANISPKVCAPYCFPEDTGATQMGTSGCVKACTPPVLTTASDGSQQVQDCQCDLVKRLDCWKVQKSPLRCGQFKQLLRMHSLATGQTVGDEKCGEICARQLAAL